MTEIWNFIAADDEEAAERVERAIYKACRLLAENPQIGQLRPNLAKMPIRVFPVPRFSNYLIVYKAESTRMNILRIVHGARRLDALLR